MRFDFCLFSLILCVFLLNQRAYSLPAESIQVGIESSFIYTDQLKRPNTSSDNLPYEEEFQAGNQEDGSTPRPSYSHLPAEAERTLGLKSFQIKTALKSVDETSFLFTLRPDAELSHDTPKREFDGRSGQPYRQKPEIKLLDTYELRFNLSKDSYVAVGVQDRLFYDYASFYSPLEFGLMTMFLRKTMAMQINYQITEQLADTAQPQIGWLQSYSLWAFQGHEDRAETTAYKSASHDFGPSSKDPYLGGGFSFSIHTPENIRFGGSFGYFDTKLSQGHVNEGFGHLGVSVTENIIDKPLVVGFDAKIIRERWSGYVRQLRELAQLSYSLTAKYQHSSTIHPVMGLHYGKSERHLDDSLDKELQSGWQLDSGCLYLGFTHLIIKTYLSVEQRSSNITYKNYGFVNNRNATNNLMRFAIEANYMLDSN